MNTMFLNVTLPQFRMQNIQTMISCNILFLIEDKIFSMGLAHKFEKFYSAKFNLSMTGQGVIPIQVHPKHEINVTDSGSN